MMEKQTARFSLHGVVSIRVVDATDRDLRVVERQLGPIRCDDDPGKVDITIRFVERIAVAARTSYVGRHEAAFTDDAFLVLRSRHKVQTRCLIPMISIGGPCEIICEHGTPAVPHLLAIINLTAAAKRVLPLHAAAFEWQGTGTVVTGWSKGGKTETLLTFIARGARYVADEWCYIDAIGKRMFGVPEPVRLWHWHLDQLSELRGRVPWSSRVKMRTLGFWGCAQQMLPQRYQNSGFGRMLQRITHLAEQHRSVQVSPEQLFEQPVGDTEGEFERLVFILSVADEATVAEPVSPEEVAERMVHSLQFERQLLLQYYRMFKFAFPGTSNPILDGIDETERSLMVSAFRNKPAIRVTHPYPVSFEDLYCRLEKFLR